MTTEKSEAVATSPSDLSFELLRKAVEQDSTIISTLKVAISADSKSDVPSALAAIKAAIEGATK